MSEDSLDVLIPSHDYVVLSMPQERADVEPDTGFERGYVIPRARVYKTQVYGWGCDILPNEQAYRPRQQGVTCG